MILVLGGVKSGKSSWASSRALDRESRGLGGVTYLATARAGDDEMSDRIKRHQSERPASWITVEEPEKPYLYFEQLLNIEAGERSTKETPGTVLLDCITLWLTNLLAPMGDEPGRGEAFEIAERETGALISSILTWEEASTGYSRQALLVSNQVETGLISPWRLGRIFQDIAGLSHQRIAAAADQVYLMTAGLAQRLK